MLTIDPFRYYRRRQRLMREALDEAHYLRRRHGDHALMAANMKARSPDLTRWGRRVVEQAVRILQKEAH